LNGFYCLEVKLPFQHQQQQQQQQHHKPLVVVLLVLLRCCCAAVTAAAHGAGMAFLWGQVVVHGAVLGFFFEGNVLMHNW